MNVINEEWNSIYSLTSKILTDVTLLRKMLKSFCAGRSVRIEIEELDNISITDLIKLINLWNAIRDC